MPNGDFGAAAFGEEEMEFLKGLRYAFVKKCVPKHNGAFLNVWDFLEQANVV
jgi:hypothetical protein